MKVLHTEWSDGWGGQEIRIVNEMLAVREKGVDVYLACREHAKIKEQALMHDIPVFTFYFRGNTDIKTLYGLMQLIKKEHIDIVNTHSGKDTWVGGLAAKFMGVKFIRTRHLSNPIRSSRLNFINELADYIFTTGESVKNDMIKNNRIHPDRIMSIPTGIDADIFNPSLYNRKSCKALFGIGDEITIGIVAVLRQFKRHDLFLEAARKLLDSHTGEKLKFIIAGDGPKREEITQKIKDLKLEDNVNMLGHVNQVPELLHALDMFVLTSDSKEGVPQSVMQALLMNKKVVATNAGSTSDLHTDDNFELIETYNLNAIIEGIEKQLENKKSLNVRNFIMSTFSKTVMVEKIMGIYEELV